MLLLAERLSMLQKEAGIENSAGVVRTAMTHLREGTLEVQTMTILAGCPLQLQFATAANGEF